MTHVHLLSGRTLGAALIAAALATACRNPGSSHHALGDAAGPSLFACADAGSSGGGELAASAQHGDHGHAQPQTQPAAVEFKGDPYLLAIDPVSGEKLGPIEKQVVIDHEGRELRFGSQQSAEKFRSDPTKYLPGVDKALVALQMPSYALETCPVSGEKLGGMGEPVDFVFRNRLVRFCCPSCKGDFLKEPGKYVAKLDAAVIAAQAKSYAPKTCVVSGDALGGEMGEPIDYVVGHRLVRLCCKDCIKQIRKDPLKHLAQLGGSAAHDGHSHGGGHDHGDHE